jgi:histidyl-tRNA synthetase
MLSTQPYKGARDFYPEDKRIQKYMFNVLRSVVEQYGYEEYDSPILESLDLFKAKSGEEIVNEQTYNFVDRGGRAVAIRPEMTPSVSRMVAGRRQESAYPLRWYSIPNLWRYERPQKGRLREHWQLNVDVFGIDNELAELELIQVADSIFRNFGATPDQYAIKVNSRKFVDYLFIDYFKLNKEAANKVIKLVDRMHKLEAIKFESSLREIVAESKLESVVADEIMEILKVKNLEYLPLSLRSHESLSGVMSLMKHLENSGITNCFFDISLMRGFDYYTDIVFEVFDTNPENSRSLMGGGRYDGLVGLFGVDPVATVGFGLGDVTLLDFLKVHGLLPKIEVETDAYLVVLGNNFTYANEVASELRKQTVNVAIDSSGKKVGSLIKTALKKEIPYVIFVGDNEAASKKIVLRRLADSSESEETVSDAAKLILESE